MEVRVVLKHRHLVFTNAGVFVVVRCMSDAQNKLGVLRYHEP